MGGPARLHVVVILGCVLGLSTADQATVGAIGSELERGLSIDNTLLGLLAAVAPLMGALGAFPAGIFVDRVNRSRLLALSIAVWSAAMLVSAFATSFVMLLVIRVALGLVTAVAGPAVASLTGDYFPAAERGRVYGFVLSGELVGAAIGFAISGEIASALSWRWSFAILALPGLALALWVLRSLPEPARGGQSRISSGDTEIVAAADVDEPAQTDEVEEPQVLTDPLAERAVRQSHVRARQSTLLSRDAMTAMNPLTAARYVMSIPSNRLLISASALSYFFLEGLETFAVIFLQRRYGIAHSLATLLLAGIVIIAIAGAVVGGRTADSWLARGRVDARIIVPGIAFVMAGAVLIPAFTISRLGIALIFYFIAALAVAAPNPPLDAARLDVVPSVLWGRAEGVRSLFRDFFQSLAPFLFGFISDRFAHPTADGSATGFGAGSSAKGLEDTFLIMLIPLLLGGVLMFLGRRAYPSDIASALENEHELAEADAPSPVAT